MDLSFIIIAKIAKYIVLRSLYIIVTSHLVIKFKISQD